MRKYELIAEGDLFRLRAVKDFAGVKAGDLGGLVSGEHNLSQEGTCWIGAGVRVSVGVRVGAGVRAGTGVRAGAGVRAVQGVRERVGVRGRVGVWSGSGV